ncbi:MAG: hypothetical protein IT381_02255 [Deltaproteobacteria bacterium]|nr:hypothetical protein [Deltaproteobacteria bacterium]
MRVREPPGTIPTTPTEETAPATETKATETVADVQPRGLDRATAQGPAVSARTAGAAAGALDAPPLTQAQLETLKEHVGALAASVTTSPTGDIGKRHALGLAEPKGFAALSLLLPPDRLAELATRGDAGGKLLREERASAELFLNQLPPAVADALSAMAGALGQLLATRASPEQLRQALSGHAAVLANANVGADSIAATVLIKAGGDGELPALLDEARGQAELRSAAAPARQALTAFAGALDGESARLEKELHARYDERVAIKDPKDPRRIDAKVVDFARFASEQPVRVVRGTLDGAGEPPVLRVSAEETLYGSAGSQRAPAAEGDVAWKDVSGARERIAARTDDGQREAAALDAKNEATKQRLQSFFERRAGWHEQVSKIVASHVRAGDSA